MSEQVVMIFRERNDVNVCCISLSDYPTGKTPEVGDKIPLQAKTTLRTSSTVGGPKEDTNIKYLMTW